MPAFTGARRALLRAKAAVKQAVASGINYVRESETISDSAVWNVIFSNTAIVDHATSIGSVTLSQFTDVSGQTSASGRAQDLAQTPASGQDVFFSAHVKAGTTQFLRMAGVANGVGCTSYFDAVNGVWAVQGTNGANFTVQNLGGGFYRIGFSVTAGPSGTNRIQLQQTLASTGASFTGDGTHTFFVGAAMVDFGATVMNPYVAT